MPKYIFLDNWALSESTRPSKQALLEAYIRRNNYTILVNSVAFVEMFNPGWTELAGEDRVLRTARFLSNHACHIVYPDKVFTAEINAYPAQLHSLPVALDL